MLKFQLPVVQADSTVQDALQAITDSRSSGLFVEVPGGEPRIVHLEDIVAEARLKAVRGSPQVLQAALRVTRVGELKALQRVVLYDASVPIEKVQGAFSVSQFRFMAHPVLKGFRTVWSSSENLGGRFMADPAVRWCDNYVLGPHSYPPEQHYPGEDSNECFCGGRLS